MLVGSIEANEEFDTVEEDNLENKSETKVGEEDFSGFNIIKESDGERLCLVFLISQEEEKRMSKSSRKALIIKLLGREIGFKALELKVF